jgi:F-type H+-transporting ATPase subunit gamma
MTSLKEIKRRISSIKNIWKITSAMRMIASAKLHRAQNAVANVLPYEHRLQNMLLSLIMSETNIDSPYTKNRGEIKRVAMVCFSSNSSLCGAFNTNVLKKLNVIIRLNYNKLDKNDILIFPVGHRIFEAVSREGYQPQGDFRKMAEKPSYADAAELARLLMELFITHQVDRVELVYNHFKSMAAQVATQKVFLPVSLQDMAKKSCGKRKVTSDYLFEPSCEHLFSLLVPKVLELTIFSTLLDSIAAEHAARTVAMQLATENAEELLNELTLLYNKSRQQAITNELLDIVGGMAR